MHKQTIFKKLGYFKNQNFKNSEYLSTNGFYLPSGINLKKNELEYVVKSLNKILD